jgi:hypothetical protein
MIEPTRLLIATPLMGGLSGDVALHYMLSMLKAIQIVSSPTIASGNAFTNMDLVRARSRAARMALDGCYTHLLFWDADVGGAGAGLALREMLRCDVDVIACPYPKKSVHGRMTHHEPLVPMGFTLIKEACLRKMWDTYYDELRFTDVVDDKPIVTVALFQLLFSDVQDPQPHRALLSEDFSFCERWLRIGGEIHLYTGPGSPLDHVGAQVYRATKPEVVSSASGAEEGRPGTEHIRAAGR